MAKTPEYATIFDCFKNKKKGDSLVLDSLALGLSRSGVVAVITSVAPNQSCWAFDLLWYGILVGHYMVQKTDDVVSFLEVTV